MNSVNHKIEAMTFGKINHSQLLQEIPR